MWKLVNGSLVQTSDQSRIKFRTNVSKSTLEHLQTLALKHDSHVNYLIENGLKNVLTQGVITYNKESRPKDRVQFKSSYDKELLENVKKFAKDHQLYINDIIEYSVQFIDLHNIKNSAYRYRIE